MITQKQLHFKRLFDFCFSLVLIPFFILPIFILVGLATLDTRQWGVFSQIRVGQFGRYFKIYKIRTYGLSSKEDFLVDGPVSRFGRFLRSSKLDELPQLFQVLLGQMSFVGPRPDIPGFADLLEGEDRIILQVKPGLTGPATLKYIEEESILEQQIDPDFYNRTIIWPDKLEINKKYVHNWRFYLDLTYIYKSIPFNI